MKTKTLVLLATLLVARAGAQSVLFDFDNAPIYTPLPISLTVGGITAQFSATGQGFSVQQANVLGFTPAGFSGLCLYPSSVYGADLLVSFSTALTNFSILYSPEEYACDSSATMRVTAYSDGAFVGSATTNAQPGTWPTETLQISAAQGFNSVVVHYDAAPITGGDYGPVFLADNMAVVPAPPPIVLANAQRLAGGAFQFAFTAAPNTPFTVLAFTNPATSLAGCSLLTGVLEISSGHYQFTDLQATNFPQRLYRVRSP